MEEEFLPYLQLGPVPLSRPSFLQGCLKAYSVTRRWGGRACRHPRSIGWGICRSGIMLCCAMTCR